MDFPKQLMSITEMRKLGYSRDMLRNMVRAQGCPVVTTKNGGKYLFDTTKFEKWHIEYSKRLKNMR